MHFKKGNFYEFFFSFIKNVFHDINNNEQENWAKTKHKFEAEYSELENLVASLQKIMFQLALVLKKLLIQNNLF